MDGLICSVWTKNIFTCFCCEQVCRQWHVIWWMFIKWKDLILCFSNSGSRGPCAWIWHDWWYCNQFLSWICQYQQQCSDTSKYSCGKANCSYCKAGNVIGNTHNDHILSGSSMPMYASLCPCKDHLGWNQVKGGSGIQIPWLFVMERKLGNDVCNYLCH